MSGNADLKSIIDASVSSGKPDYRKIDSVRLETLISAQSSQPSTIVKESLRGGGDKAGASSGILLFDAIIGNNTDSYVLRYAPMDNPLRVFESYSISQQYELHRRLNEIGLPVPMAHFVDPDGSILGLPGFVMERIEGEVADGSPFTGGLIAEASPERRGLLIDEIFRALGTIHEIDWQSSGLEPFVRSGGGDTSISRYINWFWRTAEWSKPTQLQRLADARDWLMKNQPSYSPDELRLIHGDPGLGNYMFRDDRIVAILDWELCGIAHPTYDVVMQVGLNEYFRSLAPPSVCAKIPSPEMWMKRYCEITGETLRDIDYYQKLVAFMQVVVSLSMNRSMPPEMKESHLHMLEPLWASLEAG